MNYKKYLIFLVIIILAVVGALSLSDDIISPYVSFKKARSKAGEYFQVIGSLDKTAPVISRTGAYEFKFRDRDGSLMKVVHKGIKPANFEHAEQIVALGRYDRGKDVFTASRILVKCPSKYKKSELK